MSQVAQVRPGLYLSGSDPALRLSVLSSRSISLVVNASGLQDLVYPPMEGLSVLNVPLQDQPHAPLKLYFDLVGERIHQNRTGRTLVHCSAGRSRSPSLIIAYLMRFEGLSLRRAHEAVLEQRPFIRPNAGFWRQLMEYERSLFGRNTMRMVSTPGGVLPEALRLPEDLPEALRLPEDLPEALRLPEDLPEALRLPEDPEPAYCLNI